MSTPTNQVWKHYGQEIRFNDAVRCKTLSAFRRTDIIGRVVQVRMGCGQFKSDIAFLRMEQGDLQTFENEWFEKVNEAPFPPTDCDTESSTYTIKGEFPETGFLVTNPCQSETPGTFSMIITESKP